MCLFKISNESNLRLHKRQASLLMSIKDDSLNRTFVDAVVTTAAIDSSVFFCSASESSLTACFSFSLNDVFEFEVEIDCFFI
jgi:hypothetical protein